MAQDFADIPAGAIGVYSFIERLKQGMRQIIAGTRKFSIRHIDRTDIVALTRDAAEISGIPFIMESDMDSVNSILG